MHDADLLTVKFFFIDWPLWVTFEKNR